MINYSWDKVHDKVICDLLSESVYSTKKAIGKRKILN